MTLTVLWALLMVFLLCAAQQVNDRQCQSDSPDTLANESFVSVYRPDLRIPQTVWWVLNKSDIGKSQREASWRFAEDARVARPRATHADYTSSGFDRGHMCPAADRSASISSMKQTFIMTNVCPQVPSLNRGSWKRLEDACREVAKNGTPVRIVAEAVFWKADTQRIGKNGVAVPHGFVKTVYSSDGDSILYSRYFQNY